MEKYTRLMDWENQYSENEYTTQSNLQIQYNPYQATNSILQRARTNNFTICMEIQKTSNSQSNLEKEEQYWSGLPFPPLVDLLDPGMEPRSPTLQTDTLPSEPPGISPSQNKVSKLWEIVKPREAWHAAVHGVAKTQTPLSD